jgi:hypothetical protein
MTVNEMHIAVNLGVQKIASFQADNLLPQEIDFELNIAMMRFIKQRYNPTSNRLGRGFEQSQKRIDDLRNLVVTTTSSTFIGGGFLFDTLGAYTYSTNDSNIYIERAILPLDFLFLIAVSAEVNYKCEEPILPYLIKTSIQTDWIKTSLTPPQPGYTLTGIDYYDGFNWVSILNKPLGETLTADDLILTSNYLYGFIPSYNATVVENLNNTGAQLNPPVDSNHIYLANSTISLPIVTGSGGFIRTVWIVNGDMSTALYQYEIEKTTSAKDVRAAPQADKRISKCWFAQNDDIPKIMEDPFNRTSYKSVSYTVRENFIDVYSDNTFVIPKVFIVYIRRPKSISIIEGVGCELPEHTHQEIVEMTIKSILEGIESQRYQSQSMENLESE